MLISDFFRSAKRAKHLKMSKDGKPQRSASGDIIIVKAAAYQSRVIPDARVEPDRKWFNSTRVMSQDSLKAFCKALAERNSDRDQVLLRSNKLPLALLREGPTTDRAYYGFQALADKFRPKSQRNRVKVDAESFKGLVEKVENNMDTHMEQLEQVFVPEKCNVLMAIESIFSKGQSNRIWNELYKVIDSSDVIIHVLDARDPLGTRCKSVENTLRRKLHTSISSSF